MGSISMTKQTEYMFMNDKYLGEVITYLTVFQNVSQ